MCMYNLIDDKRHGQTFDGTVGGLTTFLTENFSKDDEVIITNGVMEIITDKSNNIGFSIAMDSYNIPGIDNKSSKDNNHYLCLWADFNEHENE